jgi:hypothetical protein
MEKEPDTKTPPTGTTTTLQDELDRRLFATPAHHQTFEKQVKMRIYEMTATISRAVGRIKRVLGRSENTTDESKNITPTGQTTVPHEVQNAPTWIDGPPGSKK